MSTTTQAAVTPAVRTDVRLTFKRFGWVEPDRAKQAAKYRELNEPSFPELDAQPEPMVRRWSSKLAVGVV